MIFSKKRRLKQEYDDRLLEELSITKEKWLQSKNAQTVNLLHFEEEDIQAIIAKLKYFYLFKEAKVRKISAKM